MQSLHLGLQFRVKLRFRIILIHNFDLFLLAAIQTPLKERPFSFYQAIKLIDGCVVGPFVELGLK